MLADQARPVALLARRPTPRRRISSAVKIRPPASSAPPFSFRPALFVRSSAQERKLTPLFSGDGALLLHRPSRQLQHSQLVTNSSTQEKKLTPAFPATSPLFVRSFAQERKSSPLLSCACARFREKCRGGAKLGRS